MTIDVTPQELRLLETLRELPAPSARQLHDFAAFLAARSVDWSFNDSESLARATQRMADDPFIQAEVAAINADFADADADGLGEY